MHSRSEVRPLKAKERNTSFLSCRVSLGSRYESESAGVLVSLFVGLLSVLSLSLPDVIVAEDDFLLSVMYHPEPLKTIPAGWMSRLTGLDIPGSGSKACL